MKFRKLFCLGAVFSGFFIQGFCDIVGVASDYGCRQFGWSHAVAGLLPSLVFVWFLFVSIPVGVLMNRTGRKRMVLVGMAITLLGMVVPLAGTWWAFLLGLALLGIGNAVMQVSQNVLIYNVVSATGRGAIPTLTAGQTVKALSSFFCPLLVLSAMGKAGDVFLASWQHVCMVLGLLTIISAVWLWLSPIPREAPVRKGTVTGTLALLRDGGLLLLFFAIFTVVAVDVSMNFVSGKILAERYGWDEGGTGVVRQIYFVCRTTGALAGIFILGRVRPLSFFRVNIVCGVMVLVVMSYFRFDSTLTLVLTGAAGFFFSCLWPIIFSTAVNLYPGRENEVSGLMITAVAGGGLVTPLIGWIADYNEDITVGMNVIVLAAIYLLWAAFNYSYKVKYSVPNRMSKEEGQYE